MKTSHTNASENTSTTRIFKRLNQQDNYSLWMLILLGSLEVLTTISLYWFHSVHELLSSLIFIVLFIIFSGGIIGLFIDAKRHHHPSGISPIILTKLLGNAIAPRKLGIIYLFVFVIHLGWITNSTFDLISTDGTEFNPRTFIPLITAIVGILCLVCFFPDPYIKKNEKATKVFVSGMSYLNLDNLKELVKTNSEKKVIEERVNIIPLIRMLTLLNPSEPCKLVILKSTNGFQRPSKEDFANKEASHTNEKLSIANSPQANNNETYTLESLKNDLATAFTFWKQDNETGNEKQKRKQLYDEYQIEATTFHTIFTDENTENEDKEENNFLALLIKLFARIEFPQHLETIKNMEITFTKKCDYNNYDDSFKTVNEIANDLDNEEHEIIFNLTPGTVVVSSVMTLLAIDGDRKLYYHEQGSKATDIAKRIKQVDKSKLPIQNLLSEALEKLSGEHYESEK